MVEEALHRSILEHFRNNSIQAYSEIPFMSRIIDIVTIEPEGIVSHELKISKWKEAIEQMKEHRIGSDFCYLCMPISTGEKKITNITEELLFFGFGLALWDDETNSLKTILKAKKNKLVSRFAKTKLLENINVRSGVLDGALH